MKGSIVQINLSPGGLPKRPVAEAYLTPQGFEGDSWAHPNIHGGSQKAVLLMAAETIDALAARGYPVFYGATGENLTTRGLGPLQMRAGQRYRAGHALIELTRIRVPCASLDVYGPELKDQIFESAVKEGDTRSPLWGLSGFYAAVIEPGPVRVGDIIWLVDAAV